VNENELIQMTFTKFSSSSTTSGDAKLLIIDGEGHDVLGEYSSGNNGNSMPSVRSFASITSTHNSVTVVYEAKGSLTWEIEWSVVAKSGVPILCDLYDGVTSEEMIECYNVEDSTIDCEWTFNPVLVNQTVLHVAFNNGPSTCYYRDTIDPTNCEQAADACDRFVMTESWPPKLNMGHKDEGVSEQVKISHQFISCPSNCRIKHDRGDVIKHVAGDVIKQRLPDNQQLTLVSQLLIGCLVVSVVLNAVVCYCYIRRSGSSKSILENERDVEDYDYVMRNNELYATSSAVTIPTHHVINTKS